MTALFNAGEYEEAPTMFDAAAYRRPTSAPADGSRSTGTPRCPACGGAEVGEVGALCRLCDDSGHEAPELAAETVLEVGPATAPTLVAGERLMMARYRGDCSSCAGPIVPGAEVIHAGRRNTRHVGCPAVAVDRAAAAGSRSGRSRSRRSEWSADGAVWFGGKCEDAPCCGCCS